MSTPEGPKWLAWAREIQALAQTAHHYAKNDFDRDRAQRLQEIAAEMISQHTTMGRAEVLEAFSQQPGYITPKVDVRGAVFQEGKLLLVREAFDGSWTLPGGWADVGESPRDAVEREVYEESGLEVAATRLVGVYDANRVEGMLELFHAYKLLFLCERVSGDLKVSPETTAVDFFPVDRLPEGVSGHRSPGHVLQDAIAAWQNTNLPTRFD